MTKEEILTPAPEKFEPVDVPEWGCTVHMTAMNAVERDAFDAESFKLAGAGRSTFENYRARTVARTARNTDGTRIFEDSDATRLGKLDSDLIGRLYAVARRLNGLDAEKKSSTTATE